MEYEIKFKIDKKAPLIKRLKSLGAEDLGRKKEIDIYMRLNEKTVRIRKTGKKGLLTTKEFIPTDKRAKIREETQTAVDDVEALIKIFKGIGFKEVKRIEKIRHTFKFDNGLVLVDQLPFMGYYIELETNSFKKMKDLARKIGLDYNEGTINSYLNMFFRYFIKNAKQFKDSKVDILPLFEKEREFNKEKRRCVGER